MKHTIITCFENYAKVSEPNNIKLSIILERFKTDQNGITEMQKRDNFKELKKTLPIACFGGKFNHRSKHGLISHSSMLVLDFDNVSDIRATKKKIIENKWVISCFVSPSGNGLKVLVKIPVVKTDKEYKEYFTAIKKVFPEIDDSGKDISRACFFSYDPEIYINYNAIDFTEKIVEESKIQKLSNSQIKNDYSLASRILNIIRHAVIGERHDKILKASRLMGGYVAAEKISQEEAIRLLEQECFNIAPDTPRENLKTIIDGIENGLLTPIYNDEELKTEELEQKLGKIYFTLNDKEEEIEEKWEKGQQKGYEVTFESLKDKISIKLGATTFVYGQPASGKSQIWFEILVDLSVNYGMRHAIYSPETGDSADIFIELMSIYAQSTFYTSSFRMTPKQKVEAKQFVDKHFIVLDPQDGVFTIEDFWTYIDIIERVFEAKIHTTCADPFNEFAHDFSKDNGRQDSYLERILGANRRNARTNNRHNCLITHVQDQQIEKQGDLFYYPPATARQIAGGQAWFRKGEQMLSIWRPKEGMLNTDGLPYEKNESLIFIQKSKPKGVGEVGQVSLYYSVNKHSYADKINGSYYYLKRKREEISEQKNIFIHETENGSYYPAEWDD